LGFSCRRSLIEALAPCWLTSDVRAKVVIGSDRAVVLLLIVVAEWWISGQVLVHVVERDAIVTQASSEITPVTIWFNTKHTHAHAHTHPFNGPFSGATRVSRYQKGKPMWILLKQETVSCSGISWAICKSAPRSRPITTPAPHHSVFTGRMPFLPPNQQRQSTEGLQHDSTRKDTEIPL